MGLVLCNALIQTHFLALHPQPVTSRRNAVHLHGVLLVQETFTGEAQGASKQEFKKVTHTEDN